MRKGFLSPMVVARTYPHSHRRKTFLLPSLQQGLRRPIQPQGSPSDTFRSQEVQMQDLQQNFFQDVLVAET
ncbi:unnamed protein product [Larinioides sclopetarius]|uniref:Uncharacterized protein n=1 Tax=Larinioides sclopetarius TaxID=280406 RepID=A0AAV1ZX00_9ARAC